MFEKIKSFLKNEKNIISYFKTPEGIYTGALIDTRPEEDKKDDIRIEDIVASVNEPVWSYKTKDKWRRFPVFNQFKTNMCGANAYSKILGIVCFIKYGVFYTFSRAHIYQRRYNKNIGSGQGMMMSDIFYIGSLGVTLEQLTGERILTDYDADNLLIDNLQTKVGEAFSINGAVYIPNDIDTIASVIQTTGKGVMFLTYFTSEEWSREVPIIINNNLLYDSERSLRHFVVGVDSFFYDQGEKIKGIKIEDSSHFGGINERVLTSDWIKRRVIQVGYPMNFKFLVGAGDRPSYDGVTIVSLQKCLRYEGLFPTNISFIENLGPTTRKSIQAFQMKYKLLVTGGITDELSKKMHQLYP